MDEIDYVEKVLNIWKKRLGGECQFAQMKI